MGIRIWDIGCRESGKCMWTCENGLSSIGRVRKANGNVEYGILAAGSEGIACGHVVLGIVYWESVTYKGTHSPVTTFHIYPIYNLHLFVYVCISMRQIRGGFD